MKKIIGGKIYDTDKAKQLGAYSNYGSWNDFHHFEETLYRKKTGEYFLFGEGGAATRYAEPEGQNAWTGGSRIMPMTYKEAQKWAEEHLDADKYEEIFGAIEESDDKVLVTIYVNATKWETAKREAQKRGVGISEYVESLL